jgi:hypothetical protein
MKTNYRTAVSFAARLLVLLSLAGLLIPSLTLAQNGDQGQAYLVQTSDTLWKIAEKYLGDGHRFAEIVAATNAKHSTDPNFALIQDPNLLVAGSKLWIPAHNQLAITNSPPTESTPSLVTSTTQIASTTTTPAGHIAFSFWNNSPQRCTYEINVIDVQACLKDAVACQANRRVFKLNNVSEPALSPDGARLAFRGWGEPSSEEDPYFGCAPAVNARYLANTTLDGSELRGAGGFWEDGHPDWSPDGRRLLFDTGRNGDGITRLLVINADGSAEEDLRLAGQQPAWAPDNERLVYRGCDLSGNRCGLWLARALPAKPWETGFNLIAPVVEEPAAAHPDWSPLGEAIVFQSPASGSWDLYVINADGSGRRQLTTDSAIEGLPAWSPDGQWIGYISDVAGNWGIWIIRANGSERRQLFAYDGGSYRLPDAGEPYGSRDWLDEQISWSQ